MKHINSMTSGIRCAILHGRTHHDINGHIEHWLTTYRNDHGEHPTPAEFIAAFEAEQLRRLEQLSTQPSEVIDDE